MTSCRSKSQYGFYEKSRQWPARMTIFLGVTSGGHDQQRAATQGADWAHRVADGWADLMPISNKSLALALLIDATANTALDAGRTIREAQAAELRRREVAAQAEQRQRAEAAAETFRKRRARQVYLASGASMGVIAGIIIGMILSTEQSNGRTFGDEIGVSGGWIAIIVLMAVGLGLAFAVYDYREALDFVESVMLAGRSGGALGAICVILGVLISEIRDDDNVVEKVLVVILNGGFGGIAGAIAGALFFGAAAIVYAAIRRIATAMTRTQGES